MVIDDEDIEIHGYGLTSAAVHIQYTYPVSALLGEVRLYALLRMSRSMVRPTWVQKEVTCSEQQMSKFRIVSKKGAAQKLWHQLSTILSTYRMVPRRRSECQLKTELDRPGLAAANFGIRNLHVRRGSRAAQQRVRPAGGIAVDGRCILRPVEDLACVKVDK